MNGGGGGGGPATVPNGYLKERQDDNKSCYSNHSSPHTPDDLSSSHSNKGHARKRCYKNCNGWTKVDDKDKEIFSSKSELQLHSQLHMREVKPYKCSQCSKTFANSSYLSQHTRIHLGIKPYRCEICQRKFTQLSHLQQHIRTHTGDKPYKCRHPGCTKAFSQLSNLQSHSRCHQTDKPYKCNSCYKCFADEPSLLEHIPKHKESKHLKTHICQYCGKSYTQETYLTKHMQKHAERLEKRPPVALGMTRASMVDGPPYWATSAVAAGKMSPDSAANHLAEVLNQHEAVACLQSGGGGGNGGNDNGDGGAGALHSEHAAALALHREMNGADDYVLRLSQHAHALSAAAANAASVAGGGGGGGGGGGTPSSSTPSASSPLHPHEPIITVSTTPGGAIKTPPSSASAFTPIQSMGIGAAHHHHHHHHHPHAHPGHHLPPHPQHHHLADRAAAYLPYPFSGGKMSAAGSQLSGLVNMPNTMDMSTKNSHPISSNHFHNQLISLQQIRNYQSPLTEQFMQGIKDKKDSIL